MSPITDYCKTQGHDEILIRKDNVSGKVEILVLGKLFFPLLDQSNLPKSVYKENRLAFSKNRFIQCFYFHKTRRGGGGQVFDFVCVLALTILLCLVCPLSGTRASVNPSASEKYLLFCQMGEREVTVLVLTGTTLHGHFTSSTVHSSRMKCW